MEDERNISAKREEGEEFSKYKLRTKIASEAFKVWSKGYVFWDSRNKGTRKVPKTKKDVK